MKFINYSLEKNIFFLKKKWFDGSSTAAPCVICNNYNGVNRFACNLSCELLLLDGQRTFSPGTNFDESGRNQRFLSATKAKFVRRFVCPFLAIVPVRGFGSFLAKLRKTEENSKQKYFSDRSISIFCTVFL